MAITLGVLVSFLRGSMDPEVCTMYKIFKFSRFYFNYFLCKTLLKLHVSRTEWPLKLLWLDGLDGLRTGDTQSWNIFLCLLPDR